MARFKLAATRRRIIARTKEIVIGGRYFLSSFYGKEGAWVKVLAKSTKLNRCGWPSTVSVEVLEPISDSRPDNFHWKHYAVGTQHTCNATNLHDSREDADRRHTAACLRPRLG